MELPPNFYDGVPVQQYPDPNHGVPIRVSKDPVAVAYCRQCDAYTAPEEAGQPCWFGSNPDCVGRPLKLRKRWRICFDCEEHPLLRPGDVRHHVDLHRNELI